MNSPIEKDLSDQSFNKALVFLILIGLAIRIGFFVEHSHAPTFGMPVLDERYYDTVARMLLAGEDLRELHGFRPLLYPLFLAFFHKTGGPWGATLAIFVQHLLGVATGLIVALLGARLFRHKLSGLLAGGLYLLAPVPLYFEGELLIESSYTFLICLGLLLHLRAAETSGARGMGLWLLCGAMMVLAAQARANILIFLAIYPLFAAWRWWRERQKIAFVPLLGLAGAFAMMVPWGFVNMKQSEHFHLVPNAGGVNLYLGNKRGASGMFAADVHTLISQMSPGEMQSNQAGSSGRYQDLVEVWARAEYNAAMRREGRAASDDPMAISSYWVEQTKNEIRADFPSWLRLMAKKCWLMVWNVEVPNNKSFAFLKEEFTSLGLLPVRWIILLMLAPAGIWLAMRFGKHDALFILAVYTALYTAGNVIFFICDRYRYPIWPTMAVFAGGGLATLVAALRWRDFRQLSLLLASMGLMAALSLPNWFGATLPNFAQDFYFRSFAWYNKGRLPEALVDVDHSIALDSLRAEAQHHRGNVLFGLNRLDEARAAYEQTLKLVPGDAGVWNNLGVTLDLMNRPEDALNAFRRATECALPSLNAFLGMAFIQIRSARLEEATATLDKLDQLQSKPPVASQATRSVIERRRGRVQEANALEQQARARDAELAAWAIERAGGQVKGTPR